jgi:hypothetical protein
MRQGAGDWRALGVTALLSEAAKELLEELGLYEARSTAESVRICKLRAALNETDTLVWIVDGWSNDDLGVDGYGRVVAWVSVVKRWRENGEDYAAAAGWLDDNGVEQRIAECIGATEDAPRQCAKDAVQRAVREHRRRGKEPENAKSWRPRDTREDQ